MDPHPFRYYGTHPGDWHDYGFVLVRFAKEPDAGAKKAIGKIVDEAELPGKQRKWKGRVLSIFLEDVVGTTFERLQRVLLEVHAVAAIDEAVNHLARAETGDEWERWSLAQAEPSEDLYDPNDLSVWAMR